jgi:hypothetical protein
MTSDSRNYPATIRVRGIERPVDQLLQDSRDRRALGHLLYVGWHEVTGRAIAPGALPSIAARVRTESVIDYVSFAIAELKASPPPELATQRRHAAIALTGEVRAQVDRYLRLGLFDVFIHHEELLALAKLAIRHGQTGVARHNEDISAIGTLLLAVNDCLLDTDPAPESDEARQRAIRGLVARRSAFQSNEDVVNLIGRYFDLLHRRPALALASGRIRTDFDERFKTGTGLAIEENLALSQASTIPYLRPKADPAAADGPSIEAADPGISGELIGDLLKDVYDVELYSQLSGRMSQDRDAWIRDFASPSVDLEHRERLALYRRPMYIRTDGSIVPISVGVAAENRSLGAYWTLHSACSNLDPDHGVNDLTQDVGVLFEDYVDDLLRGAYVDGAAGILHRERRDHFRDRADHGPFLDDYRRAPGQWVKPTDAIVTEQGGLVMLEATVRGIPVEALVSGTPGSIDRYLDRITDKFEQIALVVDDIAEGRLRIPGVDDSGVCNIFPVLVLLHPFPQHYSTWDALDHDIESRRLLDEKSSWIRMREFQIITAEELEMLEPHLQSGLSMVALLRAKIGSVQYRQRSLKDFLVREWKLPPLTNPRLDRLFGEAFDVVGALIRPHVRDAIWDEEGDHR